ncbi:hypothetical protein AB0B97_17255 [Micromonospora sp. NPDC049004]|uniref:hypothetical protein n=1 Tax=Micromonospora sp. NPDC049004 TaxID=3154348 RepID=UPI0034090391
MKSYEVQIWEIAKRADRKARPWRVRWAVSGQRFEDMFLTKALAHSFRAELVQAANAGEPFDPATGRPVSEARTKNPTTWYAHSRAYVEMKWPRAAAASPKRLWRSGATSCSLPVLPYLFESPDVPPGRPWAWGRAPTCRPGGSDID